MRKRSGFRSVNTECCIRSSLRPDDDPRTRKRRERVIAAYLRQVARGRAVDKKEFKTKLRWWIHELANPLELNGKPWHGADDPQKGCWRYWMLPAYAEAHELKKGTFCKRFREMSKIAMRLYPDRAPRKRKQERLREENLTHKDKTRIRDRYRELKRNALYEYVRRNRGADITSEYADLLPHKAAMAQLINEFRKVAPAFRLGQICKKVRSLPLVLTLDDLFEKNTHRNGFTRARSQSGS